MSKKNPDIDTRLRRHPEIQMRHSKLLLCAGAAVSIVLFICWVLLLKNATQLS